MMLHKMHMLYTSTFVACAMSVQACIYKLSCNIYKVLLSLYVSFYTTDSVHDKSK